jgi:hypothetical protein
MPPKSTHICFCSKCKGNDVPRSVWISHQMFVQSDNPPTPVHPTVTPVPQLTSNSNSSIIPKPALPKAASLEPINRRDFLIASLFTELPESAVLTGERESYLVCDGERERVRLRREARRERNVWTLRAETNLKIWSSEAMKVVASIQSANSHDELDTLGIRLDTLRGHLRSCNRNTPKLKAMKEELLCKISSAELSLLRKQNTLGECLDPIPCTICKSCIETSCNS